MEFKEGDRVRIKYWKELPEAPYDEWNDRFFYKHGGKTGIIKKVIINGEKAQTLSVEYENENGTTRMYITNSKALTKLSIIPNELFEI